MADVIVEVFDAPGDFAALRLAESWCAERDISIGSAQRGAPRGLLYGDFVISKWRNLDKRHREELDGTMSGDMRNGPVVVRIASMTPTSAHPGAGDHD